MNDKIYCGNPYHFIKNFPDKFFDLSIVDCMDWVTENIEVPSQHFFNQIARVSKQTIFLNITELICMRKLHIDSFGMYLFNVLHDGQEFELLNFAVTSQSGVKYLGHIDTSSVLTFQTEDEKGIPVLEKFNVVKPLDFYRMIFTHFAKDGLTIFDANLLNGNSRIAADMTGKVYYGAAKYPSLITLQEERYIKYKQSPELPISW